MNKIPTYILALNKRLYQLLKKIPKKYRTEELKQILETADYTSPPDGGQQILESYLRGQEGGPSKAGKKRLMEYRKILAFVEDHQRDPGRYH